MRRGFFVLAAAMILFTASPGLAQIKIGVLSDLSGPTSDVGRPYADGIRHCVEYLNSQGGIAGQPIEMFQVDYAYNVQQAISAYNRFKGQGIVALQGWGTADTEALVRFVARDQIPTFSASYSAHLTDPKNAPYNFFIAADYSTQARAVLQYLRENWTEERAPKLALLYPNHPYGLAPIQAIKTFAETSGYELVGEDNVGLGDMDATSQLLRMQRLNPDYVWVGGTISSTAVILKDAQKIGMPAKFITNIWGSDEQLLNLAGPAVNGHYGLHTSVIYGADVPGMKIIEELTDGKPQMIHYTRGFASMYVMAEAIRVAAEQGKVTGPSIKAAAETLRDFDPLGLTPPVSFYPDDHRPNMSVYIYQLNEDGMELLTEQTLDRNPEWFGH